MKKNLRVLLIFVCSAALLLILSGCENSSEINLSDLSTVEYNNPNNGATITVPAEWQVVSEDENSTMFTSEDGTVSFIIKWELGGMSYFSKEELAGLAADVCNATLDNGSVYESLELTKFDVAVKAICTGTVNDESGNAVNAVCDTAIIQYFNDVRYYLVAVTDAGTYDQYQKVFTQIANSFSCSLSEDEVYEKMNQQTEAMAEAEMNNSQNTDQ
jgi:hypothetical protein